MYMISKEERRFIVPSEYSKSLELNGELLPTLKGWHNGLAEQLVVASEEDLIRLRTPRDHSERFSSAEAANKWFSRDEHIVYSLGRAAKLAGIIWFTKYAEPVLENADYTFAIRMYNEARGNGLARNFANAALQDLEMEENYQGDVWLETDINNEVAAHLYGNLNFHQVNVTQTHRTMIRPGILSRSSAHTTHS
jgi:ribosomal protein S18 acetylase RimI-like enzyme